MDFHVQYSNYVHTYDLLNPKSSIKINIKNEDTLIHKFCFQPENSSNSKVKKLKSKINSLYAEKVALYTRWISQWSNLKGNDELCDCLQDSYEKIFQIITQESPVNHSFFQQFREKFLNNTTKKSKTGNIYNFRNFFKNYIKNDFSIISTKNENSKLFGSLLQISHKIQLSNLAKFLREKEITFCDKNCFNYKCKTACYINNCSVPAEFCQMRVFPQTLEKKKNTKNLSNHLVVENAGLKGKGLFSNKKIFKGQFVCEYSGQIKIKENYIDNDDPYFYLKTLLEKPSKTHTYKMSLSKFLYIDANESRHIGKYINHSCDPNCQTERWNVCGKWKIGIFAIKNIEIGEEISFNYNLKENGNENILCRCNSDNCDGIIGTKDQNNLRKNLENIFYQILKMRNFSENNLNKFDSLIDSCLKKSKK